MKNKNNSLKEVAAAIEKARNVFVVGHQNPDGDSLGSTLAVASVLKRDLQKRLDGLLSVHVN